MRGMTRTNGIRLVATVLFFAGCGSSSGGAGGSDPAGAFAGTWTFGSGSTIQPMCSGAGSTIGNVDLTGDTLTISEVDSTHVNLTSTNGIDCNVTFTVSGSTATIEANQSCTASISGTTAIINIKTWTATLASGALSSSLTGTVNSIVTCTPIGNGTLTKSGGSPVDGAAHD
jgi:hypothetical protein